MNRRRWFRTSRRIGRGLRDLRSDSGQGLAEFALALPTILIILFGMVELANAFDRTHGLASLSREGANIAARGTGLSEVLTTVMADGQTMNLQARGGAIVSRLVVVDGQPVVKARVASSGYEDESRLAKQDSAVVWMARAGFAEGSTHYAVETFLVTEPITPLGHLVDPIVPSVLYERSVF